MWYIHVGAYRVALAWDTAVFNLCINYYLEHHAALHMYMCMNLKQLTLVAAGAIAGHVSGLSLVASQVQ